MKTSSLLVLLVVAACVIAVFCDGYKSCDLLHPGVLKGINRVLVSERFTFGEDFMKFCRSYEREKWLNLTKGIVCFGARGSEYASLVIPMEGFLMSIKLVHVSGHMSCDKSYTQHNSKWGCSPAHPVHGGTPFNVVITTGKRNDILYPKELFLKGNKGSHWYDLPEMKSNSPELILGDSSYPRYVAMGQELRVWYGEDLLKSGERKQGGKVCITAQGWYKH